MASIFNSEYGDGHKVLLKDNTMLRKVSNTVASVVNNKRFNITPGTTVFELVKTKFKQRNPKFTINVSAGQASGNLSMYMIKSGTSQKYKFIGSKSTLQNMFTHAGDGSKSSKSDTDDKTATKELATLCVFEQKLKSGEDATYDYVYKKLPTKLKKFFNEEFFESSQKQLKLWLSKEKGRFKGQGFVFERQLDNLTKKIYKNALSLSKLHKDNWNPGDIWIVKKDLDFKVYETSTNVKQINRQLVKDYNDGNCKIIHLSFKHKPLSFKTTFFF